MAAEDVEEGMLPARAEQKSVTAHSFVNTSFLQNSPNVDVLGNSTSLQCEKNASSVLRRSGSPSSILRAKTVAPHEDHVVLEDNRTESCCESHMVSPTDLQGDLHAKDEDSLAKALFKAIEMNDLDTLQNLFLEHGTNLWQKRDEEGKGPADCAAFANSVASLEYLHEKGAPLEQPSSGATAFRPVHWACAQGSLEALRFLVDVGVDVNVTDDLRGRSPLLVAAQYNRPLLVAFLVRSGADIKRLDHNSDGPIHWAAYKGNEQIIALFQYLGLQTDAPDSYGQTPLHLAAMRGHLNAVQFLVEQLDADVQAKDCKGRTPLDLAKTTRQRAVARYLLRRSQLDWCKLLLLGAGSRLPLYATPIECALGYYVYFGKVLPALRAEVLCHCLFVVLNMFLWFFFYLAHTSDPGFVRASAKTQHEYTEAIARLTSPAAPAPHLPRGPDTDRECCETRDGDRSARPLCHTCHLKRPLRAKHCSFCRRCVSEYDHHCPFIDNCVGRNNYPYFFGYCVSVSATLLLACVQIGRFIFRFDASWVYIFIQLSLMVFLFFVLGLTFFHILLVRNNLTTNEIINVRKYTYLQDEEGLFRNRFDKGCMGNIAHRLCPAEDEEDNTASGIRGMQEDEHSLGLLKFDQADTTQTKYSELAAIA